MGSILEYGQSTLKVGPFEFLSPETVSGTAEELSQIDNVDTACRYFARNYKWPEGLRDCQKRAIARRVLFAFTIIRAMTASIDSKPTNIKVDLAPPARDPRRTLEWLLISAWQAGGEKVITATEELIQVALNPSATKSDYGCLQKQEMQSSMAARYSL
ncbi:MAG: hypothetical protein JWR19_1733 [Pedosphaera sp.]|nr:hypothetical protein [Pedosphaera sp.]